MSPWLTDDLYYIVKHVPDWFPGASWKSKAKQWNVRSEAVIDDPFQIVMKQVVSGLTEVIHFCD